MPVNVIINNKAFSTEASNVLELARELALPERGVAIAVNGSIVPKSMQKETPVGENDRITVIKAAFGG